VLRSTPLLLISILRCLIRVSHRWNHWSGPWPWRAHPGAAAPISGRPSGGGHRGLPSLV